MSNQMIGVVMLTGGLVTFLSRCSFFWLSGKKKLSAKWAEMLQFVPPAVLSALIIPSVVLPGLESGEGFITPRVIAAIVAAGITWKTRSVLATFVLGMLTLWGAQAVMG